MGIAYTAMLTAFYVDNGPHLPLWDRLPILAFWLLPSAIAAPIITRALIHANKNQIPPSGAVIAGTKRPGTSSHDNDTIQATRVEGASFPGRPGLVPHRLPVGDGTTPEVS
jgi:hypothetical protein